MDKRLEPAGSDDLAEHLRACPACSQWQQEQSWLRDRVRAPQGMAVGPDFHARLLARITASARRPRVLDFSPLFLRPAMLRAAMILLLILSAAAGFFLGGPLLDPVSDSPLSAFDQTLNLDAFADLPGDSFGAVYERLLQGELQ